MQLLAPATPVHAQPAEDAPFEQFDDAPLEEPLSHPDWFKLSFLDLADDVQEVAGAGKRGLIVYFGQKYCAYCKALLEGNWGRKDILAYTQKYFDVVGLDIHGDRSVTDLAGRHWTERTFALEQQVDFTPTLVFYDSAGHEALRLTGYYPPYKFRAALEYVADAHYRGESFRSYLARADVPLFFENGDLNTEDFFLPPPHMLDRSRLRAERPLVVFFEQADCHACDVLHTGPLRRPEIQQRIRRLETVQLGMWSDQPVITPTGERTSARAWADHLGLFYAPTLIFFDAGGSEILRVDSVIQFYRLQNVLDYVLSGAYREYPNFQRWRASGAAERK